MYHRRYCAECGELVFSGYDYEYPLPSGGMKSDIEGDYEYGAGECKGCGDDFCADHLIGGYCEKCLENRQGDEDEY